MEFIDNIFYFLFEFFSLTKLDNQIFENFCKILFYLFSTFFILIFSSNIVFTGRYFYHKRKSEKEILEDHNGFLPDRFFKHGMTFDSDGNAKGNSSYSEVYYKYLHEYTIARMEGKTKRNNGGFLQWEN